MKIKLFSSAIKVTLSYNEPTTNSDTSALTDLHHTSIFYDMGNGSVHVVDLPASLSTGGGTIQFEFVIPIGYEQLKETDIWATATDNSGNTSVPSIPLNIFVDRQTKIKTKRLRSGWETLLTTHNK